MHPRWAPLIAISLLVCGVGFTDANVAAETEFDAWLHSDAGIAAVSNGYYDPEDRESGLQRFQQAKDRVAALQAENPSAAFSLHTPFALMTTEEFTAYIARSGSYSGEKAKSLTSYPNITIDWVTDDGKKECVAPVKDQGSCGSCWAFSVVGALESTYCARGNNLTILSEQQLVSCDKVPGGNDGCNGGLLIPAYQWIVESNNGGLCKCADYEYTGTDSACKKDCQNQKLGVKGSVELKSEDEVLDVLKQNPLAVAVYADSHWQYYKGGVLTPRDTTSINHGVVAVGYGHLEDKTYWKIRNSWGTSWGDNGYILLEVGHALSIPAYPTF